MADSTTTTESTAQRRRILIIAGPNGAGKAHVRQGVPAQRGDLSHLHQRRPHCRRYEPIPAGRGGHPRRAAHARAHRRARQQGRQLRVRDHPQRPRLRPQDSPLAQDGLRSRAILPHSTGREHGYRAGKEPCAWKAGITSLPRRSGGRFHAGLRNFHEVYRDIVDEWQLFDNRGDRPVLLARRYNT